MNTSSLNLLHEVTEENTRKATSELAKLLAMQTTSTEKLKLLEAYREEYETRFIAAQIAGLTLLQIQNYRMFLAKLNHAIEEQNKTVNIAEQRTRQGQKKWEVTRVKEKAIESLIAREESASRIRAQKIEQKINDEHAARKYQTKDANFEITDDHPD